MYCIDIDWLTLIDLLIYSFICRSVPIWAVSTCGSGRTLLWLIYLLSLWLLLQNVNLLKYLCCHSIVLGISYTGGRWSNAADQTWWTWINVWRKSSRLPSCYGGTQGTGIPLICHVSFIDREFEFYEFFSFLKFNEFYKFFSVEKNSPQKIRNFANHRCLTCFDVLE